ncbi:putative transposase DNA-binding domain protein [Pelotomaculum schinkii]|uniref:Putative transposase DNA-binding domain protein n=1 Tax=Pelotomaculum schinkii TaxID=78350 RepID=A0A4Y7RE84_9FIRM|nr:RNA-guided endonuclease TnpB family protein [Pelotomaculum schinkii]TEB07099.1 putative transposase DNA-binding domain protein [Pelotomaculum schinkii]
MQITVKVKLQPTKEQSKLLIATTKNYIYLVNQIVSDYAVADRNLKYSSKDVIADLPSAVKNQAIRDAKSVFVKYKKKVRANARLKPDEQREVKLPVLKKPVAIWNNQNYSVKEDVLSFPVFVEGKSKRVEMKAILTGYQKNLLNNKPGSLRIIQKSGKYIAQIAVQVAENTAAGSQIMGVDLGLKVPAVAVLENGKTKFFGNGRQNKFIKRKHRSVRRKLGKLKKLKAIKKLHDKEQRWMTDQDHKISRQVVRFAQENNVTTIRLEQLSGIRQTARTSRKNEKNLHTWSFYRLAQYVEYKAVLAGIKVEYVNPQHTSQKCPVSGELNKAIDRKYECGCGYKTHRDRLGAINIISATVADGNSLSA